MIFIDIYKNIVYFRNGLISALQVSIAPKIKVSNLLSVTKMRIGMPPKEMH